MEFSDDERAMLSDVALLTLKPVIYVANISENQLADDFTSTEEYKALKAHAQSEGSELIYICAQIEAELADGRSQGSPRMDYRKRHKSAAGGGKNTH